MQHTSASLARPSVASAVWRLLQGGLHIVQGWRQIHFQFDRLDADERAARVSAWATELLQLWRIGLSVQGTPSTRSTLFVANHISWLDILVLLACSRCHFVGKSDLARWPVLGRMIGAAGTVFVERQSKRDVRRVVTEITRALEAGQVVAVFPEGTTTDGATVLPFHANMFEAAVNGNAPVQPLSLSYRTRGTGARSLAPAYVGDDSLLRTVWRTLRAPAFEAHVHFMPPQQAEGRSRRLWAMDVRSQIVDDLQGHTAEHSSSVIAPLHPHQAPEASA
ncbi:hypothetical protein CCO03_07430 [Comamonas serinivorans]|uniref:Phospholipid/glycerol acyltransferase domain-containing protein n=1 Tax=Comamonas serinivorans TaxID=1082851 RepID=A0A1Y0EM48_9BURK|nr:lysophospholipid acyltransferase family protein [Comamonas serinivorans]ARU04531.1 hypothetical protein CCO03_07430 [Comamonas serinivorans]